MSGGNVINSAEHEDKFRTKLRQLNAKFRSKLRNSNIGVDAEKPAGSRVLLTQHPRPSRFSGHDCR